MEELCTPDLLGLSEESAVSDLQEEVTSMKKRIGETELFYRTDFPTHLQSQAEHSCCCFECGFYDPEGTECISCPKEEAKEHKNSCNKCSDMYAVIEVL